MHNGMESPGEAYLDQAVTLLPRGFDGLKTGWRSPSNIALVKYWGKKHGQLPRNPSLSFTLSGSLTEMKLEAMRKSTSAPDLEFHFEGSRNPAFEKRIKAYLDGIQPYFPFLNSLGLRIETRNTFPHSAGIASSASSMSALALCLCSLEEKITGSGKGDAFCRKASFMARLGSGSAARSVYGGFTVWGAIPVIDGSSDELAVPLGLGIDPVFESLHDAILVVSTEPKKVSSSHGHELMERHPYAVARYEQAVRNLEALTGVLQYGSFDEFSRITENEAMSLHGLMYSSDPPVMLLAGNSLAIISKIREFRERSGRMITYTIDAGPNIHLLYPVSEKEMVEEFIRSDLLPFCADNRWIDDRIGNGPEEFIND